MHAGGPKSICVNLLLSCTLHLRLDNQHLTADNIIIIPYRGKVSSGKSFVGEKFRRGKVSSGKIFVA